VPRLCTCWLHALWVLQGALGHGHACTAWSAADNDAWRAAPERGCPTPAQVYAPDCENNAGFGIVGQRLDSRDQQGAVYVMGGPQAATAPVAEPANAGGPAGPRGAAATGDGRAGSLRLPSGEQARAARVWEDRQGLCCVAAVANGAPVLALRGRWRAVMQRVRRQPRAPRRDPLHAGRVWWVSGALRSCASCLRGSGRASMGGEGAAAGPPARAPQPPTLAGAGIVA